MGDSTDETSLAPREPNAVDAYEKQYMGGHGAVLHRARRPAPGWMQLLLASSMLSGLGLLAVPGGWIGTVFLVPLGLLVWALFSMLRVTIAERAVNVQYGLFGPTIPMEAIHSAEPIDYRWTDFGGWGIRRSHKGEWMYNMPGDGGRALRIEWTDAKGKRSVTCIGMLEPEAAATAIGQAMRALPAAAKVDDALPPADD